MPAGLLQIGQMVGWRITCTEECLVGFKKIYIIFDSLNNP